MKKYTLTLLLATGLTGHAAIIGFQLSPPGTDAAAGLSPLNVVPPAIGSPAWADEFPAELYFDTEHSTLSFGFIYAGLSSPLTSVGICGAAPPGANGSQLFDLASYHFPVTVPPTMGLVVGTVDYPASYVPDLMQGRHYISLSSVLFPTGELRAQLIPAVRANSAPTVSCAEDTILQCGEVVTVTSQVMDPDGDPLVVVWEWNGWPVETNTVPVSNPSTELSLTAEFPGDGVLTVRATDPDGEQAGCSTLISVVDRTAPVVESAVPDLAVLWPPNHKMVRVSIDAVVTDECSSVVWGVVSVESNEPVEGRGDGRSSTDWEILDDHTVLLRAERSGLGNGRVYTLRVQALDSSDNLSIPYDVSVTVPRS